MEGPLPRPTVHPKRFGSSFRTIKAGEPLPTRPPDRREVDTHGYIVLAWNAPECARITEHRYVMGNPAGKHIHHVNHDKQDNRRENLEAVTYREHGLRHRVMSLDEQQRVVALYEGGASMLRIAQMYRRPVSGVFTLLRSHGVATRPARQPWGPNGTGYCKHGHAFAGNSTPKGRCRTCNRIYRERRQSKAAA